MGVSVCSPMMQLFAEQEVGRMKMKCYREILIPNKCQLLLSNLSTVKLQISVAFAQILQQDYAAVW